MQIWKHLTAAMLPLCTAALLVVAATPPLTAMEQATVQGRLAADRPVSFDVYIPVQHRDQLEQLLTELHTTGSANYQKWLTPQQFRERFGPSAADLAAAQQELSAAGLTATVPDSHRIHVTGTAAVIERAFGTELHDAVLEDGEQEVAATQSPLLPSSLKRLSGVVVGLSANVHMRRNSAAVSPLNRYSTAGPYWFDDLKEAYKFPSYQSLTGKGANIAILMTGAYKKADMDIFFGHEKLATPNFKRIDVDGGAPFNKNKSLETHLDLQQSGGMAPGAKITLYNLPSLRDKYILDGLTQIIEDNTADVVSMSFGGPELAYTEEYNGGIDETAKLRMMDDVFAQGNAQGISFVASSGDSGGLALPSAACFKKKATDTCGSYLAGVEFPASSPHVTGVGGTNLKTTHTANNLDSTYISESAFYDPLSADIFYSTPATGAVWGSGGGDSIVFLKPFYQRLVTTGNPRFRTVPDVAGHEGGCPADATCSPDDSAVIVAIAGGLYGVIGTSASAPDFAGLLALAVEHYGSRLGNANNYIYALAAAQKSGLVKNVYNWNIPGNNGAFSSGNAGYNRVLGNGTVNGANFLLAPQLPLAGTPQTPSNP